MPLPSSTIVVCNGPNYQCASNGTSIGYDVIVRFMGFTVQCRDAAVYETKDESVGRPNDHVFLPFDWCRAATHSLFH